MSEKDTFQSVILESVKIKSTRVDAIAHRLSTICLNKIRLYVDIFLQIFSKSQKSKNDQGGKPLRKLFYCTIFPIFKALWKFMAVGLDILNSEFSSSNPWNVIKIRIYIFCNLDGHK